MYVKQQMYIVETDILETILLQKSMNEDGHYWILGLESFRFIGIFDLQVQSSIVVLTNNSYTSIVQLLILFNLKIELSEGTILLLLDLDNDVYHVVDVLIHHIFFLEKLKLPLYQVCFLQILITSITVCH